MLASHRTVRPHSSCNLPTSVTFSVRIPDHLPSIRRFSWGAKSGWNSPHAGRVYRGFYTRQVDAQIRRKRQKQHLTLTDLARYCIQPQQTWRPASSWRNSTASCSTAKPREKEHEECEDWFSRWESQRLKSFNDFVREIERDPYRALFGRSNRLLGWLEGGSTFSRSAGINQIVPSNSSAEPKITIKSDSDEVRERPLWSKSWSFIKSAPVEEREYEIDPITLRKVPKQHLAADSSEQSYGNNGDNSDKISVEEFKQAMPPRTGVAISPIPSSQADAPASRTSKDWLAQEGFYSKDKGLERKRDRGNTNETGSYPPKIESAVDRHVRKNKFESESCSELKADCFQNENRQDDVELLRASDVRAAAGFLYHSAREIPSVKQSRQKVLEEQYEKRPSELDTLLAEEVASSKKDRNLASDVTVGLGDNPGPSIQSGSLKDQPMKPCSTESLPLTSRKVATIRAKLVPLKTRIDVLSEDYASLRKQLLDEKHRVEELAKKKTVRRARELLDQEVNAQQDAMKASESRGSRPEIQTTTAKNIPYEELHGEGDMASNVHEFCGRARWYKRKAPHAQCEMDAKIQRLAKERTFVREIRGIYEDTYGPISAEHRQHPMTTGAPSWTADPSVRAQDPDLSNVVTQDIPSVFEGDQLLEQRANEILPIEKQIATELQSLAFSIEDCRQRASSETDEQKRVSIIREGVNAVSESGTKLISAGLKLAVIDGPVNNEELKRHLAAASKLAGLDIEPLLAKSTLDSATLSTGIGTNPAAFDGASDSSKTNFYRILAYDSSLQKVYSAKTSSQTAFGGERPLTPLQALNGLQNPGKFLPHLMVLHNKGYDIISGGKETLILKKVRDAIVSKANYFGRPNPIDGTTTPEVSTGNFASPTGFVNHNPVIPPEEQELQCSRPPRATDKVRREEDVFSGTGGRVWQEGRRSTKKDKRKVRRRRTFKNMLLAGTVTAAACYSAGVIFEMMNM